jgi:hypothetical protein
MGNVRTNRDRSKPSVETDPRFPSGPWTGFWLQKAMPGKHQMRLSLSFVDGRISGAGVDVVGPFTFVGRYDLKTGRCTMTKRYDGAHQLLYEGTNEGESLWLWGLWTVPLDQGGFHLWPEGEEDPTARRLKATREIPSSAKGGGVLVGAGDSSK